MGMGMVMKYSYSNARTKAMESKLIDTATMKSIADARSVDAVLSILFQTDYNSAIAKFGGLEISPVMLDFAISENMAERLNKLADITPRKDRYMIRKIIARWDLSNVKLVLEALERGQSFDSISRYVIGSSEFRAPMLMEAMKSGSIDEAFDKLMANRNYRKLLGTAAAAYKKSGNVLEALAVIDIEHYKELGALVLELSGIHDDSAYLIRMDIDMRNMITLLRSKRREMKFPDVSNTLIKNGNASIAALSKAYADSESVASLASKSTVFDLKDAIDIFNSSNQLLTFEISMRNQIFNASLKLLRASVLSFGTLVDYIYLKEIEVFTLRALIKSKEYGLSKEEMMRLIVWNL